MAISNIFLILLKRNKSVFRTPEHRTSNMEYQLNTQPSLRPPKPSVGGTLNIPKNQKSLISLFFVDPRFRELGIGTQNESRVSSTPN